MTVTSFTGGGRSASVLPSPTRGFGRRVDQVHDELLVRCIQRALEDPVAPPDAGGRLHEIVRVMQAREGVIPEERRVAGDECAPQVVVIGMGAGGVGEDVGIIAVGRVRRVQDRAVIAAELS